MTHRRSCLLSSYFTFAAVLELKKGGLRKITDIARGLWPFCLTRAAVENFALFTRKPINNGAEPVKVPELGR